MMKVNKNICLSQEVANKLENVNSSELIENLLNFHFKADKEKEADLRQIGLSKAELDWFLCQETTLTWLTIAYNQQFKTNFSKLDVFRKLQIVNEYKKNNPTSTVFPMLSNPNHNIVDNQISVFNSEHYTKSI